MFARIAAVKKTSSSSLEGASGRSIKSAPWRFACCSLLAHLVPFSALVALTSLLISWPSYARQPSHSAIEKISFRQAEGREGIVPLVYVYSRIGFTIINFREALARTGEKIRQVTVGDSNAIDLSSDDPGCISNLGEYNSDSRPCDATIIYVELDDSAIGDLDRTRLSVLTDNHIFMLDLILEQGPGEPKQIIIEPPRTQVSGKQQATLDRIEHLYLGYRAAIEKNIVDRELSHKIHHFLYYVRSGKEIQQAAREAGISTAVVRKLESLGITEQAKQQRQINREGNADE